MLRLKVMNLDNKKVALENLTKDGLKEVVYMAKYLIKDIEDDLLPKIEQERI